jgi:hypothetical protein
MNVSKKVLFPKIENGLAKIIATRDDYFITDVDA